MSAELRRPGDIFLVAVAKVALQELRLSRVRIARENWEFTQRMRAVARREGFEQQLLNLRQKTAPLGRIQTAQLFAHTVPGLFAVFPALLALQTPGVTGVVVRETFQHLVQAIPYVRAHGFVRNLCIPAAQRFR